MRKRKIMSRVNEIAKNRVENDEGGAKWEMKSK